MSLCDGLVKTDCVTSSLTVTSGSCCGDCFRVDCFFCSVLRSSAGDMRLNSASIINARTANENASGDAFVVRLTTGHLFTPAHKGRPWWLVGVRKRNPSMEVT